MRAMKIVASSTKLGATARGAAYALSPSFICSNFANSSRKRVQVVKFHGRLLSKPPGIQAMLNTSALQPSKYRFFLLLCFVQRVLVAPAQHCCTFRMPV
ncbi:hypothetical protein Pint_21456 [Pistacia integerrima]|uniref:Uncharacterized protein n=1 Tax=Pistacia integerrima TaxID=434235 RepID=A0ACC0XAQ2_9ROSI|nr:hypothetical protein Pint_21456 [Pistacia integerrima]